ncbi:MAG: hypothetical protein FJX34_03815, partial [Alphaproteobacteria bacterium]|nr:hypothetical protein [Alphaproteobacteria bacterium]
MSRPGSALGTRLRPQTAKPSVIFRISEPTNEMFQATEGNARGKELVGGKSDAMDLGSFVGLGEDEINKLSIVVTVRYNDERGRIQVPLKVLRHEWNMREVRLEKTSNFDALYQNIKSVQDIIQNQRLDPATKMTWIDRILGSSALSGIISRYNRLNATPTYKLYLLTQELELILKQIDSYKTHLFGERNSFDFAPRTGNVKAEELKSLKQHCDTATNTTITQSQSLRKAFQTQLKKHLENANRVEGIQTSKPFASLTYAEKNPTVRPFVSQILNPKQMQQVLGDKQLS